MPPKKKEKKPPPDPGKSLVDDPDNPFTPGLLFGFDDHTPDVEYLLLILFRDGTNILTVKSEEEARDLVKTHKITEVLSGNKDT